MSCSKKIPGGLTPGITGFRETLGIRTPDNLIKSQGVFVGFFPKIQDFLEFCETKVRHLKSIPARFIPYSGPFQRPFPHLPSPGLCGCKPLSPSFHDPPTAPQSF